MAAGRIKKHSTPQSPTGGDDDDDGEHVDARLLLLTENTKRTKKVLIAVKQRADVLVIRG